MAKILFKFNEQRGLIKVSAKKNGKVKSKRSTKKANPKINITQWIIVTLVTVIATMWLYGMATHYFPNPVYVGGGQYFDIGIGIAVFGLLLCGLLITIMVNKYIKKN